MATRPLSLLMILHKCHEYYDFCYEIDDFCDLVTNIEHDEELDESEFARAAKIAKKAYSLLAALSNVSPTVLEHIEDLGKHFSEIASGLSGAYILGHMETIRNMVSIELGTRMFMYIPFPDNQKFSHVQLFGEAVFLAFPSAREELTSAGTAFAVGLYTASVFHSMRAVEYALRVLAADRRVKVRTKGGKSFPLDIATWEDILKVLENEVAKVAQWPRTKGRARVQATEFYGTALAEVRGFKDAWRNHIMHSRHSYIREDAVQVMTHVERFMRTLATRIGEGKVTPKVWTQNELL